MTRGTLGIKTFIKVSVFCILLLLFKMSILISGDTIIHVKILKWVVYINMLTHVSTLIASLHLYRFMLKC
jgi:formate hydrogenlyase subunit 4